MNFKQEPEGIFGDGEGGGGRSLTKEVAGSRAGMEASYQNHSFRGMMFLLPLLLVLLRSKF